MARRERFTVSNSFETWFFGIFVQGAIFLGFIPIIIPLIVLDISGNPETVGLIMAILGFSAISSLIWGLIASKGKVGLIQLLGLLFLVMGSFVLAFASREIALYMIGILLVGLGAAANISMSYTLIGGACLPHEEESSKIANLQMMLPTGQVAGLLIVAAMFELQPDLGSFASASFMVMGILALLGLIIVGTTNRNAVHRLTLALAKCNSGENEMPKAERMNRSSLFWTFILVVFVAMVPISIFESQLPNLMLDVWSIEPDTTSLVLAVGVALTIFAYNLIGRFQAKQGPLAVWGTGLLIRIVIYCALFVLVGIASAQGTIVPMIVYIGVLMTLVFSDVSTPIITARYATMNASSAQGIQTAALALAFAVGPLIAGFAASGLGYGSLTWIAAIFTFVAIAITVVLSRRTNNSWTGNISNSNKRR
jgi:predicted MFS family arabinose efflux permease